MTGHIYAISDGNGLVKIGWSINPARRLSKIQSDNPSGCVLLGTMSATKRDETAFHREFRPWRVRGEWFKHTDGVADFVAGLIPHEHNTRKTNRQKPYPMTQDVLTTPDEVIEALGGPTETGRITHQRAPTVCNWRTRNRIPPEYFIQISKALEAVGKTVSPDVFGMK